MAWHVYLEKEIIRIDFLAVVTNRDFAEFAPVVEKLEGSRPAVPNRIADMSKASGMEIGFSDMFALAERRRATRFPNAFKSAIVAPQAVHVGLARMFQMLNDHPQITIRIFPDVQSAQAWIAEG